MLVALIWLNLMRVPACAAPPADHWALLSEAEILAMQQAYLDRMAAPRNPHAATLAEWEARREVVRRHVLESLALVPAPERLPLNVHVSGELDREGYVVKRVYWQTWPSYYASGCLYLPKVENGTGARKSTSTSHRTIRPACGKCARRSWRRERSRGGMCEWVSARLKTGTSFRMSA